jgi:septum formation protein
MKNHPQEFILASASPRRKELLTGAGYRFKIVHPDIDEKSISAHGLSPADYAEHLALAKAQSVAGRHPDCIVIGADTIVDYNGLIIGKPADTDDARRITMMLFSSPHKVITGLAILRLSDNIQLVNHDTTIVYPHRMTPRQMQAHIEGGSWRDKAGAYAIQETGDEFVERIEGSMTNVMGLPMEMLERMLSEICCRPK